VTAAPNVAGALGLDRKPLATVLGILNGANEEARVIGGAVRNVLIGLRAGDIDIATTALPEEVVRRAETARIKSVPTGIEHGTVTLIADGIPFEVTTLREDVETYGRKAKVAFGRDWRADALRRDFTINALSVSADGVVHDYVNGMPDIAARRVRFVGEPSVRIAEDYLRILRFFRLHAAYGEGDLDPSGLRAAIAARRGLDTLSRERVRMELMKLLVARRAAETLTVMADAGLLIDVLGGVPVVASLAAMFAIEPAAGLVRDPVRGLAALAVLIDEDADRLAERLRLSNSEHARLRSMGENWWRVSPVMNPSAARTLLYRLGPAAYIDRVTVAWARSGADATDARWRELAALPSRWTAPAFPLKAADFLSRGIARGPLLGKALAAAEEAWIAAEFPQDPERLRDLADRTAKAVTTS
jgi:poly(A) polymerase